MTIEVARYELQIHSDINNITMSYGYLFRSGIRT